MGLLLDVLVVIWPIWAFGLAIGAASVGEELVRIYKSNHKPRKLLNGMQREMRMRRTKG